MKGDNDARPEISMPQWNFEAELADPGRTVSGGQELRLMRNLVARLTDVPALGLEAGKRYHFTAFGALGLAIASSPTLRSALDVAQRFSELTFGFARVLLEDTVRETRVTIDVSQIPDELRRFIVECTTAAMISVGRDLVWSEPPLVHVSFRFPAPPYVEHYERFYGVTPSFNPCANVLVLDRARLEHPLPQANEHALRLAEEYCRKLLERGRTRIGMAAKVRDRLEALIAHMPDMDEVANDLHLTPRTLRRRLQEEGISFVELRDDVRMTLAEELLTGPRLSLEQIAERLGYADATTFVNAFKRCRGRTPHAFDWGLPGLGVGIQERPVPRRKSRRTVGGCNPVLDVDQNGAAFRPLCIAQTTRGSLQHAARKVRQRVQPRSPTFQFATV
ncbi:MAG: AraC family transcriptional regulator [Alphaproteobacteria bacterium]|nr:AraC family transcriptional regulator [Alphaproteobacteria bacterium]